MPYHPRTSSTRSGGNRSSNRNNNRMTTNRMNNNRQGMTPNRNNRNTMNPCPEGFHRMPDGNCMPNDDPSMRTRNPRTARRNTVNPPNTGRTTRRNTVNPPNTGRTVRRNTVNPPNTGRNAGINTMNTMNRRNAMNRRNTRTRTIHNTTDPGLYSCSCIGGFCSDNCSNGRAKCGDGINNSYGACFADTNTINCGTATVYCEAANACINFGEHCGSTLR